MSKEINILCKGPNYWKNKDPKKYKKLLAKLRRERTTAGTKERAYQQVLQAKRREKGAPGTTAGHNGSGHPNGKMTTTTGSAVKRFQSAEKKRKTKLSPDRKDNHKGYGANNVRYIPQHLNRGRHTVDSKKLAEWQRKLKKTHLDYDEFITLLTVRALNKNDDELVDELSKVDLRSILDIG